MAKPPPRPHLKPAPQAPLHGRPAMDRQHPRAWAKQHLKPAPQAPLHGRPKPS